MHIRDEVNFKRGGYFWGNLEALELWCNWEDLPTLKRVLCRKWMPSNRVS